MKKFSILVSFFLAAYTCKISAAVEFPVAHSQISSEFLEPLVGYTHFKFTSGSFYDCSAKEFPNSQMSSYRCSTKETLLELKNGVETYSVELVSAYLLQNFYNQKEIQQVTFTGAIKNHPRLVDGEKIVLFFWYPLENTKQVRGWIALKDLDLSKPFVLKP